MDKKKLLDSIAVYLVPFCLWLIFATTVIVMMRDDTSYSSVRGGVLILLCLGYIYGFMIWNRDRL